MNEVVAHGADGVEVASADPAIEGANILDWERIGRDLNERGSALLDGILSRSECEAIASPYPEEQLFRSRVIMARHGFGRGRVQILQLSVAGPYPEPPREPLSQARACCERMERIHES